MLNSCQSVGSYATELLAQKAVAALQQDGLDISQVSIIGSLPHIGEHVAGYYNLRDRALVWGKRGAFWGGVWGLAFSIWLFWVPGVGPLLVTVPVVVGAAALGTASAMAAAVYSMGIPHNSVLRYAAGDQEGIYVVMFEGSARQIRRARQVLDNQRSLAAVLNMPIANTSTVNNQA